MKYKLKEWIGRLMCKWNIHPKKQYSLVEGYPHGLANDFGSQFRVNYYHCKFCKKKIHWSEDTSCNNNYE